MISGFFNKLKSGLSKTKSNFTDRITEILTGTVSIDEDMYDELEEILITCDIGVETSVYIIDKLREKIKQEKIKDPSEVKDCLKRVILDILENSKGSISPESKPETILIVGVNGVGKTTSIGKIASKLKKEKYKVIMAAADTFRAAAIDQLEVWSKRANVDLIKHQEGSDPAAVVYDAIQAAKARRADVLICDTAGRLHNKKNLMDELGKINRIIDREFSDSARKTYLVLDATTGQNAVIQAKQFTEVCNIDGIILTKLDGTAKGGVIISIKHTLNIPVELIGVGEGIDDLQEFNSNEFVEALF
ncbi:signal recognition particle receptor FtsY [Clostridium pasteurianum DSM 525 = ATCC 6013]|uniref:Signal recognition particle receptor FtsY n=1 Tax=Clostridium pasteurianum DSM 525 = ATCC 6013 TaxID=1262449 RepID=A0A0H3J8B4_CLOPA|nr:signal recognition particle-docking protein FtsY [Clostridium pasteurianum]AJA48143.1 signal recognition particle receptor FtsY [Clostridium pasteurianum DSM 525 = ATCC 6013]AJA52131.1 signal recognition particle receptor FtsY [Clostridium pasteurianum DSM 525 = ATCC 6013]AOZ75407.1 signal recognition particle-docking protein FtsY [Clostridium pasteurianum DSM 525 = ATCC 6013]AOZ79202.1 signal recognition particle-docking protein FtsY [Clostridium pasteurianum]ELP60704.1 signal recognition 